MTQNERLRALLEEARDCINTEWAGNRKTIARIDAALARPGEVHPSNLTDVVTLLENDRDEAQAEIRNVYAELRAARAEVERFKKAIHTRACQNQSAYNLECVCGADEHQRDLRTLAYRRGAEAMREAAMGAAWHSNAMGVHNKIRALPLPEDKP